MRGLWIGLLGGLVMLATAGDCVAQSGGGSIGGGVPIMASDAHAVWIPYAIWRGGSPTVLTGNHFEVHDQTVDLMLDIQAGDFSVGSGLSGELALSPIAAGDYVLNLRVSENGGPYLTWATGSLQVVAAAAQTTHPVDALSRGAMGTMAGSILMIGWLACRRRVGD